MLPLHFLLYLLSSTLLHGWKLSASARESAELALLEIWMIREIAGGSIHHWMIRKLSRPVLADITSGGTTSLARSSRLGSQETMWTHSLLSLAISMDVGDTFRGTVLRGWAHLHSLSLDVMTNKNSSSSTRLRRLSRATICHRRSRVTTTLQSPQYTTVAPPPLPSRQGVRGGRRD